MPALMAVALDTIASGPAAAARGLAALATGMVVAILGALVLFASLGLTIARRRMNRQIQESPNHDADS